MRCHARIDLYDRDAVLAHAVHHLDIEHEIVEAEPAHQPPGNVGHALLHAFRQRRGIIEAREGERAGEEDRIDHAENVNLAGIRIAFDRDLHALEQAFGDETRGADLSTRMTPKQPVERHEERIELRPFAFDLVKLGGRLDPLRPDREEGLHRLDEGGEHEPVGEARVLGNVDRPERRNRIGNDAALRQSRQIFALADEALFRVRPWQAKLCGEDSGERSAGIIVGTDDRGDVAVPDRCADAGDFGDRIGGAVQRRAPAAN